MSNSWIYVISCLCVAGWLTHEVIWFKLGMLMDTSELLRFDSSLSDLDLDLCSGSQESKKAPPPPKKKEKTTKKHYLLCQFSHKVLNQLR